MTNLSCRASSQHMKPVTALMDAVRHPNPGLRLLEKVGRGDPVNPPPMTATSTSISPLRFSFGVYSRVVSQ